MGDLISIKRAKVKRKPDTLLLLSQEIDRLVAKHINNQLIPEEIAAVLSNRVCELIRVCSEEKRQLIFELCKQQLEKYRI